MSDVAQQLADAYQTAGALIGRERAVPGLEQILDALHAGEVEIERLRAINAELLAALEGFDDWWDGAFARSAIAAGFTGIKSGPVTQAMLGKCRAAIAKAKGE